MRNKIASLRSGPAFFDINTPHISDRLVYANELAFVFPAQSPIHPGHLLVCPRRPIKTINEISVEEFSAVLNIIKKMLPVLQKVFQAERFDFAWNEGRIAGQSVAHLHFHIIPRHEGDDGVSNYQTDDVPGPRENIILPENKFVYAVLATNPIVPGHILLHPRKRVRSITEIPENVQAGLQQLIIATKKIFSAADGFNYAWHETSGRFFELALLPRKKGDQDSLGYDPRNYLYRIKNVNDRQKEDTAGLKEIARLIREKM
ncbi:MAG: HIT domain-containing protein [Candidatus Margulisbacteria bacterium]|nr:HIT domain-containing protein [Candidatus Margulisiibacteriota bacterium]